MSQCLLSLTVLLLLSLPLRAQTTPAPTPAPAQAFDKTEKMIVMRDGVRLYTELFVPKSAAVPLPIIFLRTPYGITGWGERSINGSLSRLAEEGYIFAFQDIRGRFKSEGQFVMDRPPRSSSDPKATDEGTDAYDTIDWMVKNVPGNNGRVGMTGGSYDALLAVMATLEPHPALKAVSEQATPADIFMGDDFFHNGAFRLSYGFEYAYQMESTKENAQFEFDRYDTYDWYLRLGAISNVDAKYFRGRLPTWNNFVEHPNYDEFWKNMSLPPHLKRPTVPIMHVAGWWDQEDPYGPVRAYEVLEQSDRDHLNYLVVGPWNHGGWDRKEGDKLGNINFESATSRHYREKILSPWFAHFLKGEGGWSQPEAIIFQTGANKWAAYEAWPPRNGVAARNLYFHADGRLSFDPPRQGESNEFDAYVSDPTRPVPYRQRPVEPTYNPSAKGGSRWYTWLLEDQRFVQGRPDVLSWETEALKEDMVISGRTVARLFASTSGTDSDWVVKLIDVYPEEYTKEPKMGGYQLMVASEILRGRFRKSFERPEAVTPNQVNEYVIDLHTSDHRFLKGHRVMVQVQSTWFPLYDRNPQTFVPNIHKAKESDYRSATQRVYRSARFPSHLSVSVAAP